MRLDEALAAFLAHVAARRAPATLRAYTGRLKSLALLSPLAPVCGGEGQGEGASSSLPPLAPERGEGPGVRGESEPAPPADSSPPTSPAPRDLATLTRADLESWLSTRAVKPNGQPCAPDTIRLTIAALQQFHAWLIANGCLSKPILPDVEKPIGRERELLPTRDETAALLAAAPADFGPIYRALRLTGARPGELCRATIADFDRRVGEIVLTAHKTARKTGRSRRIAIGHPALVEILNTAIGDRISGEIFLRTNGRPWTADTLSATYRRARLAAGLPAGLVLYLARHEHATALYRKTGNLKDVADALGHTQLTTSNRYTRIDAAKLKSNQSLFDE